MKKYLLSHLNLTIVTISVLLIMIVFNLFSGMLFGGIMADITGDKRYSLTDTTKNFLKNNQTPINMRLYVSKNIKRINPIYGAYADYINRFLEKYVANSHGLIKFSQVEIEPFSSTDIEAQKAGITDIKLADAGIKLGAKFITSRGNSITIPQFDIIRSDVLEDDISRKLSFLTSQKRPIIGVISPYFDIASQTSLLSGNADWPFITNLKKSGYMIYPLSLNSASIPPQLDAVMVFYPFLMNKLLIYALDQYLLKGGRVMIMLDSLSKERYVEDGQIFNYDSGMDDFLRHHGLTYYNSITVGDVENNQAVELSGDIFHNPFYPIVYESQMMPHPITENLHQLNFEYTSMLTYQNTNPDLLPTILFSTSPKSGILPASYMASKDYLSLTSELKTHNQPLPLAIMLEGNFIPFYKAPIVHDPKFQVNQPIYIREAEAPGKLLVVGDSDIASISSWQSEDAIKRGQIYTSDNLFFIRNALDYLSGTDLISAGSKYLASSQQNLNDILFKSAQNHYGRVRKQLFEQMSQNQKDIADLEKQYDDDNFNMPIKFKKHLDKLHEILQQTEISLQRTDYQIKEYHHLLLNMFSAFIIIIPTLLGLLAVFLIYQTRKYFYSRQK